MMLLYNSQDVKKYYFIVNKGKDMKKLLLIMMTLWMTVSPLSADKKVQQNGNYERLCKLFTQKAKAYKLHMRDDTYAQATLASYEKRAKVFCDKK